ncbi:MAG: hypothetical protein BWY83_01549 [bacterium ADurb.Bin478]|nr:MAG: hypothetical protein BWY83_01549 [bacterium ADurb.Bin478]
MMTVAGPVLAAAAMRCVGLKEAEVKYSVALPMTMPEIKPMTMDHQTPIGRPSSLTMPNERSMIRIELLLTPRLNAESSSFWVAPSLVRTRKMPRIDSRVPTAATSIGAMTALYCKVVPI